MGRNQDGVIHLVLLALALLVVIAVFFGLIVIKPDLSQYIRTNKMEKEETMTATTPTVTAAEVSDMEKEVNSQDLSDPTTDFTIVDQDINSL